jgi:antitoxin HicB
MSNAVEIGTLDYYLTLNYPITIHPDPDGGYVAEIKDLPGCLTQGETIEETIQNINEARELWLETVYELGREIPLPTD